MSTKNTVPIGQTLVDEGVISPEQLEKSLREQKKTKALLCTTVARLGFATEDRVFSVLAKHLKIPYLNLRNQIISPEAIQKMPAKFVSHYKILPVDFKDHCLTIAMADPLDVRTLDDIRLFLGVQVKGVLASETDIAEAIHKYYGVGAETLEKIMSTKPSGNGSANSLEKAEDIEGMAEDASVIKFVNQILSQAVRDRATDIHFEPFHEELRVRFRIDGILYDVSIPETIKYFQPAIVSRLKIMARMNIAERRLPQDGRIKIKIGRDELDLRVSVIPTVFGEAVQIRLLASGAFLELEKLGMTVENRRIIETAIAKPHGIFFVTGPTGSGKSTTLYACLSRLNSSANKIITIEDPVEYQLRGVNQIQVNPVIGLDFAAALRHILRHDPDVLMIGEVRDGETAEIAIRSALTGHLVFSTLHTNDAAGAVTRLLDMNLEPFLVSSSLELLAAQRLVRLICPDCRTPMASKMKADLLEKLRVPGVELQQAELFEGKGCEACRFTGYRGRTGIHELLVVNEPIRDLIMQRASAQSIRLKAISQGMRTLREDGLQKALQGLTTIAEVARVTLAEDHE